MRDAFTGGHADVFRRDPQHVFEVRFGIVGHVVFRYGRVFAHVNQARHNPDPFTHLRGSDVGDLVLIDHPARFEFAEQLAGTEIVEFGYLIFAGVEIVIEILGVVEVLKRITVLKPDNRPRFGLGGVMAVGVDMKHVSFFFFLVISPKLRFIIY